MLTDPMLTTYFDLETQIRSRQDELQREATRARLRSGALRVKRSMNPSRPIATFLCAMQLALCCPRAGQTGTARLRYMRLVRQAGELQR